MMSGRFLVRDADPLSLDKRPQHAKTPVVRHARSIPRRIKANADSAVNDVNISIALPGNNISSITVSDCNMKDFAVRVQERGKMSRHRVAYNNTTYHIVQQSPGWRILRATS